MSQKGLVQILEATSDRSNVVVYLEFMVRTLQILCIERFYIYGRFFDCFH